MAADPRIGLAQKYALSGLHDDAWEVLHDILSIDTSVSVLQLAASIQLSRGMFAEANKLALRAVDADPRHHETMFNLALSFEKLGDFVQACETYHKALDLNKNHAVTWNNLGGVFDQLGKPIEAIAAYQRALTSNPKYGAALNNLGVALMGQGQFAAAQETFQKVLQEDVGNTAALINLGVAEVEFGEVMAGLKRFDDVLAREPENASACDNRLFSAHYVSDEPDTLVALHRQFELRSQPGFVVGPNLDPERKLRVGYVSPDFRRHSVAFFIEPLLQAHDRKAIEVFCYSNSGTDDDVTGRLRGYADHWRSIVGQSTADAVQLIKSDGIDILVDLAGHTVGNRLDVFAACAAAIQVTGIGYPNTTGLLQMSARFADMMTDPFPQADAWSIEKIIRLKTGLHCYTVPSIALDVGPLPALARKHITFGSFNKRAKISEATIDLWSAVLKAVPFARLLIKAKALGEHAAQQHLAAQFATRGIAIDRLQLSGWRPADADHLALYNDIDIALDTYPYNGTTTTCEGLWMGVPVITRVGQAHAARVGASLLTTLKLPELICADAQAYTDCAVRLAGNFAALSELRRSLRERMRASDLCQPQKYAQAVESEYRVLWRNYCAKAKA